jgi:hypothetical protein
MDALPVDVVERVSARQPQIHRKARYINCGTRLRYSLHSRTPLDGNWRSAGQPPAQRASCALAVSRTAGSATPSGRSPGRSVAALMSPCQVLRRSEPAAVKTAAIACVLLRRHTDAIGMTSRRLGRADLSRLRVRRTA